MNAVSNQTTRQSGTQQWTGGATVDAHKAEALDLSIDALSRIPERYQVISQIGTGGSGIVFKVRDLEAGEIVALKILRPGIASSPAMQEALRKEVRVARKVTHRNVCRIHEFNRANGTACISMEFVEGESLLTKLNRVSPLELAEAVNITRQICAGLREAHVQNIVHRDLKPANIMLDQQGTVKIMDFGIARVAAEDVQMTRTISGTPAYMAPEQLELTALSPRTDIYALGLLLYEMVTGLQAFAGDSPIAIALKQVRDTPRRPREICPSVPARLEAIIMKCLQKDPARRYQSVDELDTAIRNVMNPRDVSWLNSLERRLAQLEQHPMVKQGVQKMRAAGPQIQKLAGEVRGASVAAARVAFRKVEAGAMRLRSQDWRALARTRTAQGLAVLAGGILIFGVAATRKSLANESAKRAAHSALNANGGALPGTDFNPAAQDSAADGGRNVTTAHVELSSAFVGGKARTSTLDTAPSSSPVRSNPAPRKSAAAKTETPHTVSNIGPSAAMASKTAEVSTAEPDFSAAAIEAPAVPSPAEAPATKPAQSAAIYLEVGSFKDSTWAQNAVVQLLNLGFHAVSVHQSRLWMQSYHVHVGPFANAAEVVAAQKSLADCGFKSHVVK